jgi:flagellar motor protein MotB
MSPDQGNDSFNFWPVYSDLAIVMILVLTLLSMGLMVLVTHLYALVPTSVLEAQDEVRRAVRALEKQGARVCDESGNNQKIVLSGDAVWDLGKSSIDDMKPKGRTLVEQLGSLLASKQGSYQRIQIEGHASYESSQSRHVPQTNPETERQIETQYGITNWKLSAARAAAVMQMFIASGVPDFKLAAAARGHYHPVMDSNDACQDSEDSQNYKQYNVSSEQRQRNRRINILIMYSTEK